MEPIQNLLKTINRRNIVMADSRDEHVWTNHAEEQWEENKTGHSIGEENPLRKKVVELNPISVLDLGCGGGLWRKLFAGYKYTGVDQNANMIKYAKMRWPDDTFVVAPGESTPFEDSSFDVVFTAAVLQHNKHDRKLEVAKEIYRILKPGGFYLFTENTFREDNYRVTFKYLPEFKEGLDDGYSFTPKGWENFLTPLGFRKVWYEKPSEYLFIKEG